MSPDELAKFCGTGRRGSPLGQLLQHLGDDIQSLQNGVDAVRRCRQAAGAKLVEKTLQMMGPVHQMTNLKEAFAPPLIAWTARKTDARASVLPGLPFQEQGALLGLFPFSSISRASTK